MSSPHFLDHMYISDELVKMSIKAASDLEVLDQLADLLIDKNIVHQSFKDAVKVREKEFPTGLALNNIGIAIPHTDPIHVVKQSIAIGILDKPVIFRVMGGDLNDYTHVKIVFMLAITDPQKQIDFLQALVNLIQDDHHIMSLLELSDPKEIIDRFKNMLESEI